MNAGAAIYVGGAAASLAAGVERAAETVDSGAAAELLDRLIATTAALGGSMVRFTARGHRQPPKQPSRLSNWTWE